MRRADADAACWSLPRPSLRRCTPCQRMRAGACGQTLPAGRCVRSGAIGGVPTRRSLQRWPGATPSLSASGPRHAAGRAAGMAAIGAGASPKTGTGRTPSSVGCGGATCATGRCLAAAPPSLPCGQVESSRAPEPGQPQHRHGLTAWSPGPRHATALGASRDRYMSATSSCRPSGCALRRRRSSEAAAARRATSCCWVAPPRRVRRARRFLVRTARSKRRRSRDRQMHALVPTQHEPRI